MAADITRSTFNPVKHYSSVRQQQGRVSMDADWNEQADIAAHRVQTETADLVGRTGAPRDNPGFKLIPLPQQGASADLAFSPGRMYVDGILCELEATAMPILSFTGTNQVRVAGMVVDGVEFAVGQWVEVSAADSTAPAALQTQIGAVNAAGQTITLVAGVSGFAGKTGAQLHRITTYRTQPDFPSPPPLPSAGTALAYLDVWERTITALEDSEIRDAALGTGSGADTATRNKTICQVKLQAVDPGATCSTAPDFTSLTPQSTGQLAARAEPAAAGTSACILPPRAGFRRLENQLYRVEIQVPGNLATGKPTFKWSRDNGSVVTSITSPAPVLSGNTITLNVSSLGRDQVLGFVSGQWVELTEDSRELSGKPGILVQVTTAAQGPQGSMLIADTSLAASADLSSFLNAFTTQTVQNPKVRRWDQSGSQVSSATPGGDVAVREGVWVDLESGVQIFFQPGGNYQAGDYWLIPARTVTGDADWPRDSSGNPQFARSHGIRHRYCRLGIVNFSAPAWTIASDCRQVFAPLADSGIHIKSVFLTNTTEIALNTGVLLNDGTISLQDLANGISVVCDAPIDPVSILVNPSSTKPTCYVTIDIPNSATPTQLPFAAQPMVVAATLKLDATGTIITWTPTAEAASWIQNTLSGLLAQTPSPRQLLSHLKLRGNFIWALGNPSLYLDGETFGSPAAPDGSGNQRTTLLLPSGDGRRGGDFEMWFRLISLPAVVVSPTAIDFGTRAVNTPGAAVPVTLVNNSKNPVTISSIAAAGDFAQTTTCPAAPSTLAAGGNCTINVTFTPTLSGLRFGSIMIAHSAPGSPLTIPLAGTGLAPSVNASLTTVSIPSPFGIPFLFPVTLSNTGSADLILSSMSLSGPASADYILAGPCFPEAAPTTLPPGGNCILLVNFLPRAFGSRIAVITINHNAQGSPLVISLNCIGIPIS